MFVSANTIFARPFAKGLLNR